LTLVATLMILYLSPRGVQTEQQANWSFLWVESPIAGFCWRAQMVRSNYILRTSGHVALADNSAATVVRGSLLICIIASRWILAFCIPGIIYIC